MKIAHVRFKEIYETACRFDASPHLSDGIVARRLMSMSPYKLVTMGDVSKNIFMGNRAKRVYVANLKNGIPFLSSSNMLQADLDHVKLISKKYTHNIEQLTLKQGWTLISRSGTIGKCAFTSAIHAQKLASEDVIRVVPNNILRPGIIYAYLASRYGYSLLTQGTFGSVIQHIEPQHVANIPIPLFPTPFQEKIDKLIQTSAQLRDSAAKELLKATTYIEERLAIPKALTMSHRVSMHSILDSYTQRFEATYHIADGQYYFDYIINNCPYKYLGEVSESISRPGIFKRHFVKQGVPLLGISDIMLSIPNSDKQLSRIKTANATTLMVKEGTILVPRAGTVGDVVLANSHHTQKFISEHIIRVVPNDIFKGGYIFAFLASSIGKALIKRLICGAVIQYVEPPHLATIPVPILSEGDMAKVDNSVTNYRVALGKAATLELQAISLIELEMDDWRKLKQ